jgi:diacylglycerol kinase (ATP)
MAAPSAAFLINPVRVRNPARLRDRCAAAARAHGWEPVLLGTSGDDPGGALCGAAVAAGAGLIVAVGGDGTVRACAQELAGTRLPLAIVPCGTANLAARALGIPCGLDAALDAALGGREKLIDLADVSGTACVVMAGIGLDAEVVAATPEWLRQAVRAGPTGRWGIAGNAGWLAYAASGAAHLAGRLREFTVRVDDRDPLSRRARCVVVGNAGIVPGGFALLPDARLDDGVLDVGLLAASGLVGWTRVGYRVVTRGRANDRYLERLRARRVEVIAAVELPRQVDGEMIVAARSLEVRVRPRALVVRVPPAG